MAKEDKPKAKNPTGDARELVDLVIAYAKQETIEPLKGLGKNAALGLGGALLLGIGGSSAPWAPCGRCRAETDWFERHNLTYLPYGATILILVVLSIVGWFGLGPGKKDT